MGEHLNKMHREIMNSAREFALNEFNRGSGNMDNQTKVLLRIAPKAASLGFTRLGIPEACNGAGFGIYEKVLVAEVFCKEDSTLGAALILAGHIPAAMIHYGNDTFKRTLLPHMTGGDQSWANAFFEPEPFFSTWDIKTQARYDDGGWIINGTKTGVINGCHATHYIVLARTGSTDSRPGLSLFRVEKNGTGAIVGEARETLGLRASLLHTVHFSRVKIPEQNALLMDEAGWPCAERTMEEFHILMAAISVGIACGAFDRAFDHIRAREQFGQKIADFQMTRHKVADMAARIETARLITRHAAASYDIGRDNTQSAIMARLVSSQTARYVTDQSLQLLGGYGYVLEHAMERYYRDAQTLSLFFGTELNLKDRIADQIIGDKKSCAERRKTRVHP